MKTNLRFLALSAAILSMFTACQREELEQNQKPEALTHSVTFVAGAPETKTTVDISDGATAQFAWTADDKKRISVYENGVAATKTECGLVDGVMTIKATFEGSTTPENASYVAVVNSSNDGQIMSAAAYDESADILVSKAVNSFDGENGVLLQFKREVAIAKMTLKGLDDGEVVNMVTVSSTSDIAGSYGVNGWASPAKTSLEISSASYMGETDGYSIVANESGEAVVWFTCIPQDATNLTVKVKAADGDTYTKEFSKAITLTRGDVKAFGVAMVKDTPKTYGYQKISEVSDYTPGDYIIVAHVYKEDCPTKGDFAIANDLSLSSKKLLGNEVTNLIDNDVISVSDGASYKLSLSGNKDKIVISNGTNILAYNSGTDLVLDGDNKYWTLSLNEGNGGTFLLLNNSTATASTKRALSFQSYSTSGSTKTASLKFGAYAASNINKVDYAAIELYKYQEVTPSTPKYSVTFAEITGGTLSATPSKAEAGAEVTLIATPDAGYVFNNDWTVTAADNSSIEVAEGKFIMPAQDVTVSASFSMAEVTATYPYAESFAESQGKFTISDVTLPVELTYVWQHSSYNNEGYMKASAYKNQTNYAAESWLISPVIDMSAAVNPVLSFMNTARYGSNENLTLWAREKDGEWSQLSFSEYGTGSDWNFVSNKVDVSAYAGKTLQFAFKYVSTSDGASTWEIKNVEVNEKNAAPTLTSIEWTGYTTSYTVGDTFKADGTVTANYSDGSTADVTSESSFSSPDMSTEGTKSVTVTYMDKTTTGSINVKSASTGEVGWTRVSTVAELLSGGTFIIGYEATANSGIIIPMANTGRATTSAAGFIYSGSTATSGGKDTIDMSAVSETSNFEVTIVASNSVSGAICIKLGDNYLGNTDTKNNCKLFTKEATTTAFTPTVDQNNVFTLKIAANKSYHTLQYNASSPRFAVYGGAQKNVVIYKKGN